MSSIREYLLGIVAAAILCAIVSQLAGRDGFLGSAVKLITGVFMLIALVSPVMKLRIRMPSEIFTDISQQADQITTSAVDSAQESVSAIIKEQTQAYILDKAKSYGLDMSVEVTLSDAQIPEPISVKLSGKVSPYNKKILSEVIEKDLGIPTEAQIWN